MGIGVAFILAGWALASIFQAFGPHGLLVTFSLLVILTNILAVIVYLIGIQYGDRYDLIKKQETKCEKHPLFSSDTEDY